jgi:hypothetical protein
MEGATRGGRGFGRGVYGQTASPAGRGFGRGALDPNSQAGGRGSPRTPSSAREGGSTGSSAVISPLPGTDDRISNQNPEPYTPSPSVRGRGGRRPAGGGSGAGRGSLGSTQEISSPAPNGGANTSSPYSDRRGRQDQGEFFRFLQLLEEHKGVYEEHIGVDQVSLTLQYPTPEFLKVTALLEDFGKPNTCIAQRQGQLSMCFGFGALKSLKNRLDSSRGATLIIIIQPSLKQYGGIDEWLVPRRYAQNALPKFLILVQHRPTS